MKVSFKPLRPDAIAALSRATMIDFSDTDFSNEEFWFCCTVRDAENFICLVLVFEFKTPFDAHVTTALFDKKALSRRLLTAVIGTVFRRAARITAFIDPSNQLALTQVWRMGFKYEGYMRKAIEGDRDAVVFGMLPENCPYLLGEPFRIHVVRSTHPEHPGVN